MEFFRFLKWHWDSWSFSHRVYVIGAFFVGAGIKDSVLGGGPNIMMQIGFAIWFSIFLKWFVWDMFWESWAKYKQDRNSLLTKIKNSDQEGAV